MRVFSFKDFNEISVKMWWRVEFILTCWRILNEELFWRWIFLHPRWRKWARRCSKAHERTEKSPIYRKNSSSIIEGLMILHWSASDGMAVPISARVFLMMMVVEQVVRSCQVEGASRVQIFLTPVSATNPLFGNKTSLLADQYQNESLSFHPTRAKQC